MKNKICWICLLTTCFHYKHQAASHPNLRGPGSALLWYSDGCNFSPTWLWLLSAPQTAPAQGGRGAVGGAQTMAGHSQQPRPPPSRGMLALCGCRGRTLIDNLSIVIVDIVHIQTGRLARMMDWSSALVVGGRDTACRHYPHCPA